METYREYVGNPHVHSVYSDGTGGYGRIASAANAAKLNFVIVTDHNVHPQGAEGYQGQTLVLSGEELHNVRTRQQANHLLAYGTEREMAPYAFSGTRSLIQACRQRDGVCYIAHPIERRGPLNPTLRGVPRHAPTFRQVPATWSDWPPEGIHGMEIWNYMSEFRGLLWSRLVALAYALQPAWGIRGPYRATLRLWDELLAHGYHIAALGGADAHATTLAFGPVRRTVFPYEYLFRCVNTHVLANSSLTGDVDEDKALIYEALRAGRTWVGYDLPHSTRGFRCLMQSGSASAVPGQEIRRLGAINLTVTLPAPGEIHLRRDGKVIRRVRGQGMKYTSAEAGIYRVEVYRRYRGHRVGWIFASPIYVE